MSVPVARSLVNFKLCLILPSTAHMRDPLSLWPSPAVWFAELMTPETFISQLTGQEFMGNFNVEVLNAHLMCSCNY